MLFLYVLCLYLFQICMNSLHINSFLILPDPSFEHTAAEFFICNETFF